MNFKEVEKVAREKFNGSCKVCKECKGIDCACGLVGSEMCIRDRWYCLCR